MLQSDSLKPRILNPFLNTLDERVMIAIPTLGIGLSLIFRGLWQMHQGIWIPDLAAMLSSLLLMDAVHVVFTFVLVASLPELRKWSVDPAAQPRRGWLKGLGFWPRTAIISVALGSVIFVLRAYPGTGMLRGMATTYLFLELLGPAQHTIAQMRGISFCYNSNLRKQVKFSDSEVEKSIAAEKRERRLFSSLLVGEVLYWLPEIFLRDRFEFVGMDLLQCIGGSLATLGAIGLVINAFSYPRVRGTNKTFYLTRVLLFPLKMLTPMGGLAVRATHGSEYLIIFKQLVQNSSLERPKKKAVYLITAASALSYASLIPLIWPSVIPSLTDWRPEGEILALALCVTFVIRFAHYYMDSVLFRMSDPSTRAAIGPLLVPAAQPAVLGAKIKRRPTSRPHTSVAGIAQNAR